MERFRGEGRLNLDTLRGAQHVLVYQGQGRVLRLPPPFTHVCVHMHTHTNIYFSTSPKYILHLYEPPSHYLPFSTQASQPQKHSTPMGTLQHPTLFPKTLIKTHSSYHVIHSPHTLFSKLLHSSIPTHRVT